MGTRTSAGTIVAISAGIPATFDQAGYEALTFTDIGELTDAGEFGREYALVTHNPVATRGTQKKKGSFNEGSLQLQIGLDTDDAGQILMKAAVALDADHSLKITTQNGDVYYMQVQVMTWKVSVGGVDQITSAACTCEITTNSAGVGVVEVLAA